MSVALSNYALAIAPTGRYQEAEKCFREALTIQEDILGKDSEQAAQTLHNIALLYRNSDQLAKAEAPYEQSRQIWKKKSNWGLLAVSYKDSALLCELQGDYEKGLDMIKRARHAIENLPDEIHANVTTQVTCRLI